MTENNNTQNANLLHRAFLFLEDGEWDRADEYAERVLDNAPENSDAYLCKLMSELRIARTELLSDARVDILQCKNYINALKYADATQKKFLENCAQKAHERFVERERKETHQDVINTFSRTIENYREIQQSNRDLIRLGEGASKMYVIAYVISIVFIAAVIVIASLMLGDNFFLTLIVAVVAGLGIQTLGIIMWVGHARLVRFWDLDEGDDRGWIIPIFFGMVNYLTLGIWGLVKSVKTRKECKGLRDNNAEMERQIGDLQQKIEEQKARLCE